MSLEIDKLYYTIDLDIKGLQKDMEDVKKKIEGVGGSVEKEGSKMDGVFKKLAGATAAFFSAQAIAGFVNQVIRVRGEFQQLGIAFETMLGSKEKADQLMQEAITLAAKTPFTLSEVGAGAKSLLAYGFTAKEVIGELKTLGDVSAGLAIPLADLVYLYGTQKTQGTVMAKDMMQFAGRGVPIYEELTKVLKINTQEVRNMVTAGKVGFPEIQQAFKNMTSEGGMFSNMMEKTSLSVTGQMSNLTDKIQLMLNEIGKSNEGIIYGGLSGASSLVDHYKEIMDVLKVLTVAYGTYKTAVILAAVVQKLMLFAENIRLIALFRKELGLATAAQQAFNITSAANPYFLILAGITAVVAALVIYKARTKDAYVAGAEYNKSLVEEKEKLKSLFEQVKNTTEGV